MDRLKKKQNKLKVQYKKLSIEYLRLQNTNIQYLKKLDVLKKIKKKDDISIKIGKKFKKYEKLVNKNMKLWATGKYDDKIYKYMRDITNIDKNVKGAGIAFEPNIYKGESGVIINNKYRIFGPFVTTNNFKKNFDVADIYDYTDGNWEWWTNTKKLLKKHWTKPFYGELTQDFIILYCTPIIIDNIYYGVLYYEFQWKDLNMICGFV